MAALIRIVNAFYAALFSVAAMFLIAAAPSAGGGMSALFAGLAFVLAILCLLNMRPGGGMAVAGANVAALLLAGAGLLAADPALNWIGGASALPFALALTALLAGRRPA